MSTAPRSTSTSSPTELQTFFITFGGPGIRNGWVKVQAYDELIARKWARWTYGRNWSGIYSLEEFSGSEDYYPAGELGAEVLAYQSHEHVPSDA